jgi:hypothetical protein
MGAGTPDAALIDAAASPARRRPSCPRFLKREQLMIRVQPATPATSATDGEPDDLAMRVIEIGLAVLAAVAAGVLALVR